ncbi:MAG: YggS family pyridoxal phosphate-dependent enzyme [Alphaproteobacteria bacterium]|nr:YggS family pyridoxal phosphate-dependent enzyme [Alphaproteobacteria bacterium]
MNLSVKRLTALRAEIGLCRESLDKSFGALTVPALIAISKTVSAEDIRPVLEAGQKIFGENRVQEAQGKWPALREEYPDSELHLIGHLQSRKVPEALHLFDVIQTLDRESLARVLAEEIARSARKPKLFVQVNTGEEPQKSGISPKDVANFIHCCRIRYHLEIEGLMCLPPLNEEPALHFAFLAKLAKENGIKGLSMGMSRDYLKAMAYGATHLRIGRMIFGERH